MTVIERNVPEWCRLLMEISLWAAIAVGVFFVRPLGVETTRTVCSLLLCVTAAMWLLHALFLRRPPVALTISSLGGGIAGAVLVAGWWSVLGDSAWMALLCLVVFLAIPGAFTESQVSRLLAFLCIAGCAQVFYCLAAPTLLLGKASFLESLRGAEGITGTLMSEAELTAFLVCYACAAVAFGLRAFFVRAPARSSHSVNGLVNRIASPGANMALLGGLSIVLVLASAFLCRSLFAVPTLVVAGIVVTILLASKRVLSSGIVTAALVLLALTGAANLALPAWGGYATSVPEGEEEVTSAFTVNFGNLQAGIDVRSGIDPEIMLGGQNVEEGAWTVLFQDGAWGMALQRFGKGAFFLLMLACALLLVDGIRSLVGNGDAGSGLLAGAMGGFVALLLVGLWGSFAGNPGIAIVATAFCAMTAAGGDYDEEFVEIEIIP